MTELTIRPDEIRDALERFVTSYEPEAAARAKTARVLWSATGGHADVHGAQHGVDRRRERARRVAQRAPAARAAVVERQDPHRERRLPRRLDAGGVAVGDGVGRVQLPRQRRRPRADG